MTRKDTYLGTIDHLEPEIAMVDRDAALASIAVSLKRIADCLEAPEPKQSANLNHLLWEMVQHIGAATNR